LVVDAEQAVLDEAGAFRAGQAGRRSAAPGHGEPPHGYRRWIVPVLPNPALVPSAQHVHQETASVVAGWDRTDADRRSDRLDDV